MVLYRFAESLDTGGRTKLRPLTRLRDAGLRQVACIIQGCQLRLHEHVARFLRRMLPTELCFCSEVGTSRGMTLMIRGCVRRKVVYSGRYRRDIRGVVTVLPVAIFRFYARVAPYGTAGAAIFKNGCFSMSKTVTTIGVDR